MDKLLNIKEVAEILQVNERTILRMIKSDTIPATKVGNQWRFHPQHLEEWLLHNKPTPESLPQEYPIQETWKEDEEFQMFAQERIRLDVKASDKNDALAEMVKIMHDTGHLLQKDLFYHAVLKRETISTTGVGHGVAVPHAWHPINDLFRVPLVACARLENPVEFDSVDDEPVDLIFLLCAPRNREHLKLIKVVSSIAQNVELLNDLRNAKTPSDFLSILQQEMVSTSH